MKLPTGSTAEERETEEALGTSSAGTHGTSVALRKDQEDSSRARGGQKRNMLEPDPERGMYNR